MLGKPLTFDDIMEWVVVGAFTVAVAGTLVLTAAFIMAVATGEVGC